MSKSLVDFVFKSNVLLYRSGAGGAEKHKRVWLFSLSNRLVESVESVELLKTLNCLGADASERRNDPDTDAWKRQLLHCPLSIFDVSRRRR